MFEQIIERYPRCLTVLTSSEQKLFGASWSSDSKLSGLPTVRSVVNAVIKQVFELSYSMVVEDKNGLLRDDHWNNYTGPATVVLGSPFPAHALISVDGIETADDVVEYINKVFSLDRGKYPKKDGWHAVAAHSSSTLPLDKNHPFMRAKENGYLDTRCCRFLVVNEMAVEGLNNKNLLVWGAAETIGSRRKCVQRIGRLGRTAAVLTEGELHVPPASHDQIYIFTHETFESMPNARGVRASTAQTIADSVAFILDMHQATADIMSVQEYVDLDVNEHFAGGIDRAPHLTHWDKYAIAASIGTSMLQGRRPQISRLVRLFGGTSAFKKQYVHAFSESAINQSITRRPVVIDGWPSEREVDAIADIKYRLLRATPPDPVPILEAERMARPTLDIESAGDWLARYDWGPALLEHCRDWPRAEWLKTVNRMFASWEGQFDKHPLAQEIVRNLSLEREGAVRIRALVLEGALHYLPSLQARSYVDFDDGGPYCRPEITFVLRSENFVSQLQSWVCFVLLKEGYLNALWAVLRNEVFWETDDQLDRGST
jgi:hypothetical protein